MTAHLIIIAISVCFIKRKKRLPTSAKIKPDIKFNWQGGVGV